MFPSSKNTGYLSSTFQYLTSPYFYEKKTFEVKHPCAANSKHMKLNSLECYFWLWGVLPVELKLLKLVGNKLKYENRTITCVELSRKPLKD